MDSIATYMHVYIPAKKLNSVNPDFHATCCHNLLQLRSNRTKTMCRELFFLKVSFTLSWCFRILCIFIWCQQLHGIRIEINDSVVENFQRDSVVLVNYN